MNNLTQHSVASINFNKLWEVSEGKKKMLLEILRSIEKGLIEYPKEIEKALKDNQPESLEKVAHKCKSCTNYLYHEEITQLLEALEQDGRGNNITLATADRVERLKFITAHTLPEVQKHINLLEQL
ncbi:MAG: hypothetical protein AAGI07_10640 [Bacteroidota bacterium]